MSIKSVGKAVEILNCFSVQKPILGISDISRMLGYTKSTVSRLLSTLSEYHCVERTDGYGKYKLGYRMQLWGTVSQELNTLPDVADPIMEKLRDKCHEEVSLYVIQGDHRVCLLRFESLHEIARVGTIGGRFPLHAGASGRVLLAYLPKEQREKIMSGSLKKFTGGTIINAKKMEASLAEIRKNGYGISTGEREAEAFSVVAPVWDASERVVASLSISGPNFRLTEDKSALFIKSVVSAAKEISIRLGHV
ncbi:MAG: IclR family transcriptional regulator [Desulfobacterales bacterium]|nr:IclR family transcriptional regulator [Desulfobacterales bacterium]